MERTLIIILAFVLIAHAGFMYHIQLNAENRARERDITEYCAQPDASPTLCDEENRHAAQ